MFPQLGFHHSLSESLSHLLEVNMNPITPERCQLIHPLMAITSIAACQIYVTTGRH